MIASIDAKWIFTAIVIAVGLVILFKGMGGGGKGGNGNKGGGSNTSSGSN